MVHEHKYTATVHIYKLPIKYSSTQLAGVIWRSKEGILKQRNSLSKIIKPSHTLSILTGKSHHASPGMPEKSMTK